MKILFVSPYPPAKDGLASYTKLLVGQLRSEGCEVTIIRTSTLASGDSDVSSSLGINIRRLYVAVRTARPDVVHIQYTITSFGLIALSMWVVLGMAKVRLRTKLVVTFHEVKRETALLYGLGALYYRLMGGIADSVTVHTHEAVELLVDRCHIARHKIHYVPHPLYVNEVWSVSPSTIRETYGLEGKRVILFFGYIHVDKGIDHLLSAFSLARRLEPRMTETRLVIAGSVRPRRPGLLTIFEKRDCKYRNRLHEIVDTLGLTDSVQFIPYVPEHQIGGWFRSASVVVMPYTKIEQSGVLNIALTCRTPIIASRLGGFEETLSGTNALVTPGDEMELAEKIILILTDELVSRSLVEEYDAICRERTIEAVTTRLLEIYRGAPFAGIACQGCGRDSA